MFPTFVSLLPAFQSGIGGNPQPIMSIKFYVKTVSLCVRLKFTYHCLAFFVYYHHLIACSCIQIFIIRLKTCNAGRKFQMISICHSRCLSRYSQIVYIVQKQIIQIITYGKRIIGNVLMQRHLIRGRIDLIQPFGGFYPNIVRGNTQPEYAFIDI